MIPTMIDPANGHRKLKVKRKKKIKNTALVQAWVQPTTKRFLEREATRLGFGGIADLIRVTLHAMKRRRGTERTATIRLTKTA